ncbi:hypothetical protein [Desulfovibrio sp. X2]|uniref:hypothetical protein n=1 Tax=Desulfovibrio sp. X2 TaxID=941449 RepID=UPI0003F82F4F|nr:hypothetical protein [Desulfovibrio sp. X2]
MRTCAWSPARGALARRAAAGYRAGTFSQRKTQEAVMDFFWFLFGLVSVIVTLRIISTTFQND